MIYFVATPIGNLKDISLRALEILRSADVIYCEDTRRSLKLLNAYDIKKPLKSCHKFNEREAAEKIIEDAQGGKEIAIISDAGMPVISDPGNTVCAALRKAGVNYSVAPGANACLSALLLSAFPTERFAFLGFLPDKAGERKKTLERYARLDMTLCLHCAPQDIDRTISSALSALGDRRACAVREITKLYEEVVYFNLSEGLGGEKRGEYVLLIEGAKEIENPFAETSEREHILGYMRGGMDKKTAVKQAAKDRGVAKSELYKIAIDIGEEDVRKE